MKKTINISLGGTSFVLEEDAYSRLESYINKLKTHFAHMQDAGEIVSDIESRFAEQLLVTPGEGKIVTLANIDSIIATMGEPEQFGEDRKEEAESRTQTTTSTKRFFRNPDDVIIAGVASGLAAYLGIEAVWVRLVFGLSLFAGGFGLAVYIILWIVVPEAKTETEKMQMRGQPVNLAGIEQMMKERMEEFKKKDRSNVAQGVRSGARKVGQGFGAVVQKAVTIFGKVIAVLVGIAVSVGAAAAIIGLVIGVTSLLFNANSAYIDFPFRELAHGWIYYVTVLGAFFAVFVPLMYLLLLGTSLLARRSTFTRGVSFSLLGVWVLAIVVAINGAFYFAPQVREITKTSPYFKTTTRQLDLKDFTNVELTGATRAVVHKSDTYKVVVTGTEQDLEHNRVSVQNGTLVTDHEEGFRMCMFCNMRSVSVDVYMPNINELKASGASRVSGEVWGTNNTIDVSGASNAELSVQTSDITAQLSGASRLTLSGTANTLNVKESGASHVFATSMQISTVTAELSGASRAEFGDVQILTVNASGASNVYYNSVKNLQQHTSGASKVIQQGSQYNDTEPMQPEVPELQ